MVGDAVWVRQSGTRCSAQSKRGAVTGLVSQQVVEVNGVPRHVRDLRRCAQQEPPGGEQTPCAATPISIEADLLLIVDVPQADVQTPCTESSDVFVPGS